VYDGSDKEVTYWLVPVNNKPELILNDKSLMPRHLDDLRRSGITPETMQKAGVYSETNPDEIQRMLGWSYYDGSLSHCMVFPYRFPDESPLSTGEVYRLKPDAPREDNDGVVKYEHTKGHSSRAYFPPNTLPVLYDPLTPLIITEGEKKALKADQEGFPCIGIGGVDCWSAKRTRADEPRELMPDLANLPWQGRRVYICFDSDRAMNPDVRRAEKQLARALGRKGAEVKIVTLPQEGGDDE
jgi:hypothetical protein